MIFWCVVVGSEVESGYCVANGYWDAVCKVREVGDPLFVCWSWLDYASLVDLCGALKELCMMVGGGMRLEEGFECVGKSSRPVAWLFRLMSRRLLNGAMVRCVMKEEVSGIDKVVAGILSVCDGTRKWGKSIESAVRYLENKTKMIDSIRGALVYPLIVMTMLCGVVGFYVSFLGLGVLGGVVLCGGVSVVWVGLLLMFLLADRIRWGGDYVYAYYFVSLAALMRGGLSLQDAMDVVTDVFDDERLEDIRLKVLEGVDFYVALDGVSEVASRIMKNGERSNSVVEACGYIGELYMKRIEYDSARISALFGPVMLGVVGVVLMIMVSATGFDMESNV